MKDQPRYTKVIAEVQSVGTGTSCLTRRTIVAKGEQMIWEEQNIDAVIVLKVHLGDGIWKFMYREDMLVC